ncbi:hypothetical protein DPMN_024778 [Dreissena polymorpha]|uniref:Uncharacterized protein n=1 Tax=Dreissena polymorpha TaxID=45954 RepID=A0A9D4RCN4_DREPO|nr:hypothetical protein DPMN_024778 [Dreissena polymorpha]
MLHAKRQDEQGINYPDETNYHQHLNLSLVDLLIKEVKDRKVAGSVQPKPRIQILPRILQDQEGKDMIFRQKQVFQDTFKQKFESYRVVNRWSDSECRDYLNWCLEGKALDYLDYFTIETSTGDCPKQSSC